MRNTNNTMLLFLVFVFGCFGSRSRSDGDFDAGVISAPESGVDDTGKTNWGNTDASVVPFDARTTADDRRIIPPAPVCDNDIKEEGEVCDGDVLPCGDGLVGEMRCEETCLNYYDDCHGFCGNGFWDEWEDCEGFDFRGETCRSLTGRDGTLNCTANCRFDTSMCYDEIPAVDDGGVDDANR